MAIPPDLRVLVAAVENATLRISRCKHLTLPQLESIYVEELDKIIAASVARGKAANDEDAVILAALTDPRVKRFERPVERAVECALSVWRAAKLSSFDEDEALALNTLMDYCRKLCGGNNEAAKLLAQRAVWE